jgi:hypothetical protein
MNPSLPKDCNCEETATNQGVVCNNFTHTSDDFFYNGPDSSCTGIQNHDDITVVIQKLQNYLCSIEVTQFFLTYIEENIEEFPEFITLINDALTCQTITNCFIPTTTTTSSSTSTTTTSTSTSTSTTTTSTSSSTTTTTTTIPLECRSYTLESDKPISNWTAVSCDTDEFIGGIVIGVGQTVETGCVYNNTLELSGLSIIDDDPCPPTTTTTSSSSTSTTTTTINPCNCYALSSTAPDPEEPTEGFTNFRYDSCSDEIIDISVLNDTVINICAKKTPSIISGDPGSVTPSEIDCCSFSPVLYDCNNGDLLIVNNSNNIVEEVFATGWIIASTTPTGPYETMNGEQNGTSNSINVSLTVNEPGCVSLYVNSLLIETISFYYSNVFIFAPVIINSTDCVWIIVNNEC